MFEHNRYTITTKMNTGSTNDDVVALARAGASEGRGVCARVQDAGRGQFDRVWTSLFGGMYLSFLMRPTCGENRFASLSPVVALAVYETLRTFGVESQLKWPNDVLVGSQKICGILLEAGKSDVGPYVVIGVGINVFPPLEDVLGQESFTYLAALADDERFAKRERLDKEAQTSQVHEVARRFLDAFDREYETWNHRGDLSLEQRDRYDRLLINRGNMTKG